MLVLYAAKNKLTLLDSELITSGSVNVYTVSFQFSAEWDGLTRMAVFKAGADSRSVLLDDTSQCTIPWEVLIHGRRTLSVGVLGTKNGEIVLPTIWASLGEIRPGANSAEAAGPPTPSLWEQQLAAKGDALGYTDAGELGLYSGGKLLGSVPVHGDHVHPTDTTRLGTTGDGSQVTVSFNAAAGRGAPGSGETLAAIMGKLAKNYADLGALAYKDGVSPDDLDATIKASLAKADSALQGYTETDPTVPAWAKAATKPTYTAAEVGAIPAAQADTFAKKSDLTSVYRYKGSVAAFSGLPTSGNEVGDVWNVEATDMNYGWTGSAWDPLGQLFQLEYLTADEIMEIMGE